MGRALDRWNPSVAQLILFAVGGGLVFIGEEFGVPLATDGGVLVLGVLMVVVGAEILLKKVGVFRSEGWPHGQVVEAYWAVAEILWAIVFIIGGLATTAVILVEWFVPATPDTFWVDLLVTNTGIGSILGLIGLMILVDGLIRAIVGSGRVDPRRFGGLAGVFDRAVGAATAVVGLGMTVLGLVLLVSPGRLTAMLEQLRNQLGSY